MPVTGNRIATRGTAITKESGESGKAMGLDTGDILKSISGVLVKIFKPESKEGKYGGFTIQNCEIAVEEINGSRLDESTTIRVSIFDEEIPEDFKGTLVSFKSVKNKGAFSGVSYEVNESKGKIYENIKVSGKTALIEQLEGGESETENYPPAIKKVEKEVEHRESYSPIYTSSRNNSSSESRVEYDNSTERTASKIVLASALIHEECFNFVIAHYPEHKDKWPELAATIFIQASMKGAVDKKLTENLRENKPTEKSSDYSDWRGIIIPVGSDEIKGLKLGEIDNYVRYQLWDFLRKKENSTGKPPTEFAKFVFAAGEELDYEKNPPKLADQEPEDDNIPF